MSLDPLISLLVAVIVLLIGTVINRNVKLLSKYNIPDPITGGLLFATIASVVWVITDYRVTFDQTVKPVLLLMFFAGVGMCADLSKLKQGGKALVIFLLVLLPFIIVQNAVGVGVAKLLDLHPILGLVGGSITLVGGHGTGAAYAERFAQVNNLQAVMELTMTVATLGLIIGGILAGPVAEYLIKRYNLRSQVAVGATTSRVEEAVPISPIGMAGALAGILAAVVAARWLAAQFPGGAIIVPTFLWCMPVGVAIRNVVPLTGVRFDDRAASLMSGLCLGLFLVMAMMALNLIEVALSAGPFIVILTAQVVAIVLYAVLVCFRFMGGDYEAAVTSAAFIGFNMGSTATAMANMQALTNKYGPAPRSYLIVPLSGAFFVDIMNAFVLTATLALPFMGG